MLPTYQKTLLAKMTLAHHRTRWLGQRISELTAAMQAGAHQTFETLYTETTHELKWRFKTARQLTFNLHQPEPTHTIKPHQLKLFAA